MIYKRIIRPLLFLLPAESVHHLVMGILKFSGKIPGLRALINGWMEVKNPKLERTIAGLTFPNPVGLAAGFDKDAMAFQMLGALGFGFVEIGTLTPKAQPGNEKPRLFRLKRDQALINRMGFNNEGVVRAHQRLSAYRGKLIVGGNIGKNKLTPNDEAINDYLICYRELYPVVDYFVVNISSPNTPGLRELQDRGPLLKLLTAIQSENSQMPSKKPVFLKIAPDLELPQVDDIISILDETHLSGIIISNTTINRSGLKTPVEELETIGAGGLSGKPLLENSNKLLKYVADKSNKRFAIIASGGIHSGEDALLKLSLGADLVQLYTGFIYEGPALIKRINNAILKNMH